ncbi:hypothetical protein EV183_001042 [Coemansia sp. RSA 2336]|nr:hypothetical protein EV183_001042 [Coemansia sp. RSA 2336]
MSLQVIELSDSEESIEFERPDTPELPSPSRLLAMSRAEALSIPSSPPLDVHERVDRLGALRDEAISVSSLADSLPSSELPAWRERYDWGSEHEGEPEDQLYNLFGKVSECGVEEPWSQLDGLVSEGPNHTTQELWSQSSSLVSEGPGHTARKPRSQLDSLVSEGPSHTREEPWSQPSSPISEGPDHTSQELWSQLDSLASEQSNHTREPSKDTPTARELSQANRKKLDPSEILGDMTLVADQGIQAMFKSDVFEKVREHATVRQEEGTSGRIYWEMHVRRKWDEERKLFVPLRQGEKQRVGTAMVVMTSDRFEQLMGDLTRLQRLLEIWKASLKASQLVVCVLGMQKAIKRAATQATQEFARQVRLYIREGKQAESVERRGDLQVQVLKAQVACPWAKWVGCESEQAMGQLMWQTTLDVGLAHGQRDATDLSGVHVRSGTDLTDSWTRMLAQIPKVTVRVAQAVVSRYPTPHRLLAAWHALSLEEQKHLLSKIPIPGSTRKMGTQLSARIHLVLTQSDPQPPSSSSCRSACGFQSGCVRVSLEIFTCCRGAVDFTWNEEPSESTICVTNRSGCRVPAKIRGSVEGARGFQSRASIDLLVLSSRNVVCISSN